MMLITGSCEVLNTVPKGNHKTDGLERQWVAQHHGVCFFIPQQQNGDPPTRRVGPGGFLALCYREQMPRKLQRT